MWNFLVEMHGFDMVEVDRTTIMDVDGWFSLDGVLSLVFVPNLKVLAFGTTKDNIAVSDMKLVEILFMKTVYLSDHFFFEICLICVGKILCFVDKLNFAFISEIFVRVHSPILTSRSRTGARSSPFSNFCCLVPIFVRSRRLRSRSLSRSLPLLLFL